MTADHACPVCDAGVSGGSDLRVHLMVEHRKSELAGFLQGEGDRSPEETLSA